MQFKGWAIAESRVYFLDGKVTELIEHMGGLQSAHEKALLYVAKGRYKIKRMVKTEVGEFWRDVGLVGDYGIGRRDGGWKK